MTAWCLSLPGDPSWWQAVAGLLQVIFAAAVWWVTKRYANLTAQLVALTANLASVAEHAERRELYDQRMVVYQKLIGYMREFAGDLKASFQFAMAIYRDTAANT